MNSNLAYEEKWREEIIGGEVVMMAPARTRHNLVKNNLNIIFGSYLRGKPCTYLPDGEGLILSENEDEYIPDGMVVCDPGKIREDAVYGAPDLVIEVLSPSSARYDRGLKKDSYERYGVREYWIVNPDDLSIEQYLLKDGRLVLRDVYHKYSERELAWMKPEDRAAVVADFQCSLFDDLTIHISDVFERVAPNYPERNAQ